MKSFKLVFVLLGVLALVPVLSMGQNQGAQQGQQQEQQQQQPQQQNNNYMGDGLVRVSKLLDFKVQLAGQGQQQANVSGNFKDLVITLNGYVPYVMIRFNQQENNNGKNDYVIPTEALNYDWQNQTVTLDISPAEIQNLPELKSDQLPDTTQPGWDQAYWNYWVNNPNVQYAEARGVGQPAVLATDLMKYDVADNQDQNLGSVDDIVMNTSNDSVQYIAISEGGFLGIGNKLIAIPMADVQGVNRNDNKLTLQVSQDDLKNTEGFDKSNWPKSANQNVSMDPNQGQEQQALQQAAMSLQQIAQATGAQPGQQGEQQTAQAQQGQQGQAQTPIAQDVVRFTNLRTYKLQNTQGTASGSISDVIISDAGYITFAVAKFPNEATPQGQDTFVVPFQVMNIDWNNQTIGINIQKDKIHLLPVLENGKLPDTSKQGWDRSYWQFWSDAQGVKPYSQAHGAGQPAVLASDLMKYNVSNNQGNQMGGIEDVVMNTYNLTVDYLALSSGGILGIGNNLLAVPFADVRVNNQQQKLVVYISDNEAKNLQGFSRNNWPKTPNERLMQLQQGELQQGQQQ